jgi:hypothetical protein
MFPFGAARDRTERGSVGTGSVKALHRLPR